MSIFIAMQLLHSIEKNIVYYYYYFYAISKVCDKECPWLFLH